MDVVLVMTLCTREALVAESIQYMWQHVVKLTLLLNQFPVWNHLLLLILLLKDIARKLLLLKYYGVAPPKKKPLRLSSASTTTQKEYCRSVPPSSKDFFRTPCYSRSARSATADR